MKTIWALRDTPQGYIWDELCQGDDDEMGWMIEKMRDISKGRAGKIIRYELTDRGERPE
jgi:hypothetical protein